MFVADSERSDTSTVDLADNEYCSETTLRPSMVHYDDSIHEVCDDDHPTSQAMQADVVTSLENNYPTVGSLIDAGFIPYFDFFADGDWAHWINPEFLGDGAALDAERPESILVDNTWWRPIGVMYVATDESLRTWTARRTRRPARRGPRIRNRRRPRRGGTGSRTPPRRPQRPDERPVVSVAAGLPNSQPICPARPPTRVCSYSSI